MQLVAGSDPTRLIIDVDTLYACSMLIRCFAEPPDQSQIAVDNFSWNSLELSSAVDAAATRQRLAECVQDYGVEIIAKPTAELYAGAASNIKCNTDSVRYAHGSNSEAPPASAR
jgi:hypothetical protein